jgi:hypothetical protein
MDALDCPDGSAATPVRGSTTTPVQAFAMLNDAFLLRQCEHVAARLEHECPITDPTDPRRVRNLIQRAFRLLLLREPTTEEQNRLTQYTREHGLANACQILINTSEFVHLE